MCVLLLISHLTDTPSHSIFTLRSITQSYCSHFLLFSILSSLLCCCAAPFDPIFLLSSVTHCSRDSIVLVTCYDMMHFTHFSLYLSHVYYY
jgi:hypothetical protein